MTPGQLHALKIAQMPIERRHAIVLAKRFRPPSTAHVRALDLEHLVPGRAEVLADLRAILEHRPHHAHTWPFAGRRLS